MIIKETVTKDTLMRLEFLMYRHYILKSVDSVGGTYYHAHHSLKDNHCVVTTSDGRIKFYAKPWSRLRGTKMLEPDDGLDAVFDMMHREIQEFIIYNMDIFV
nr:hypothetical protein 66 [bacterium]